MVSNPISGVTLTGSDQEFSFDFPQALPINATDVYLQAVYKGPLGDETSAVVVATQDISEPTFFSYVNSTDYNFLNGHYYTRAQIADPDNNLLQYVSPGCVSNQQLSSLCLNPISMSMQLQIFGSITAVFPVTISVSDMLEKQFIRVAYLVDSNSLTTITKPYSPCQPQDPFPSLEWQLNYSSSQSSYIFNYPIFLSVRGISGYDRETCVNSGDGTYPPPDAPVSEMSAIANPAPVPVQIGGW